MYRETWTQLMDAIPRVESAAGPGSDPGLAPRLWRDVASACRELGRREEADRILQDPAPAEPMAIAQKT